ncbi:MAG: secE [Candidatus Saccharibacteria bacterium]|nr:secE [Candidatus Saccharibacteria bacterium]
MAESKNVTRIKATDSTPSKSAGTKVVKANKAPKKTTKKVKVAKEPTNWFTKALFGTGRYFKGAWTELKQVRWPTRKATWGLTLAVILFSVFFVVLILLLDAFFKFIFELMIK